MLVRNNQTLADKIFSAATTMAQCRSNLDKAEKEYNNLYVDLSISSIRLWPMRKVKHLQMQIDCMNAKSKYEKTLKTYHDSKNALNKLLEQVKDNNA